jgi:hypothetical protein
MKKLTLKKVVLRDLEAPATKLQGNSYPSMHPCPSTETGCYTWDPWQCWTVDFSVCMGSTYCC